MSTTATTSTTSTAVPAVPALPATLTLHLGDSFSAGPQGNWHAGIRATNSTKSGVGVEIGLSANTVGVDAFGDEISTGVKSESVRTMTATEAEQFAHAILHAVFLANSVERDRRVAEQQAADQARFGRDDMWQIHQNRIAERAEELRKPRD